MVFFIRVRIGLYSKDKFRFLNVKNFGKLYRNKCCLCMGDGMFINFFF